jgi:phospho-N-acetylmuramoyl-pentapeptide-transferase
MISMFSSAAVAFLVTLVLTPYAIRYLRSRSIGQFIQEEVGDHFHKHGTPTMGGVVLVFGVVIGYLVSHVSFWTSLGGLGFGYDSFTTGGLLALMAFVGMGAIGFVDDYQKVFQERNLGLNKSGKFLGQLFIAAVFVWALSRTEMPLDISFTRPLGLGLPAWAFTIWALLALTGTANAVNITDGLDGLASGASALVFGAYTIMTYWIFRNPDFYGSFIAQDLSALDVARFSAAVSGATLGFLWWNAAPAKIFMGDVGSQAIGGGLAAVALLTHTHLLLPILAGLFVWETVTVIGQIASFRLTGKRILLIAPIHHHYERSGWPETTVIVRFWIIASICVALGLGIFYGDFVTGGGL